MSSPPSQRLPDWHRVWAVLATGLPLAVLTVGCLNSQRVPPDTAKRPSRQVPARPTIAPARATGNKTPSSWKPLKTVRRWNSIVLHHTATEAGSVASIHANHLQRTTGGKPWLGIGYHFVVGNGKGMPDGYIEPTFRWRNQLQGAHAGQKDHNQHGIGIALIGNFEKRPPTAAQLSSLRRLIVHLRSVYAIPANGLVGHSDIKATACPGKLFPLANLKRDFAKGGITP